MTTSPRSPTRTGTPSLAVHGDVLISSTVAVRPTPWTSNMPSAWRMLPPPTLQVVVLHSRDHFVERQAVLDEASGIEADLILLLEAAPAVDLGRPVHRPQLGLMTQSWMVRSWSASSPLPVTM